MSPRTLSLFLVSTLAACDVGNTPPEQLEAVDVRFSEDVEEPEQGLYKGTLAVEGQDADYTLSLTDATGATTLSFEAHSPGAFDLSALAGEGREVNLLGGEVFHHQSVVVEDESGPLWVADLGDRAGAVSVLIGGSPVRAGEVLASAEDDTWTWSYTSLIVPTDEGDVELLPGDVETVSINGVLWRFVAVAAYTREPQEGASLPGCPVMFDMLAYEMVRVEAREVSGLLERPAGLREAALGCAE